ncbi:hypothetical protein L1856_20225 [Streptomyces sp. Tue 6430]|nr:hypothetical protein [Streptomyces sp. Tue 6430]
MPAGAPDHRCERIVDAISPAEAHEEPANRRLMAGLFALPSTLALAGGRYEAVLPAYRKAVARGAGDSAGTDFEMLRQLLSGLGTGPARGPVPGPGEDVRSRTSSPAPPLPPVRRTPRGRPRG